MAVEKAEYVKELNKDLPLGGDSISEGDNHIRLIKETLTGSFPNIDSPVTATPAQINGARAIFAECTYNGQMLVGDPVGISSVEWVSQDANGQPDWKFCKVNFTNRLQPINSEESSSSNGDINARANVQVTCFANKAANTAWVVPTTMDLEPDFVVIGFRGLNDNDNPNGASQVVWDTGFCLTIIET